MLSLAETTDLLDRTTTALVGEQAPLTGQSGVELITAWLPTLQAGENTRLLADQLVAIKALLDTTPVDEQAVKTAIGPMAEELSLLATQMGGEGEMPALLEGLSTALRQAAGSSKATTTES